VGLSQRAIQLQARTEELQHELENLLGKSQPDRFGVDLQARGIEPTQAADLRARLKTFAEDWDRPEASIYDEDPAR
jgi:hypothetical protein